MWCNRHVHRSFCIILLISQERLNSSLGLCLNALMYLSPIIYPVRELSGTWYFLASFNPLTIGIESVRGAIIVDKFLPWHFYVNGLLMLGVLMLFSSFFYILNFYKGLDRI